MIIVKKEEAWNTLFDIQPTIMWFSGFQNQKCIKSNMQMIQGFIHPECLDAQSQNYLFVYFVNKKKKENKKGSDLLCTAVVIV